MLILHNEYFNSPAQSQVVSKFAKHFQTQEPMPENLLHKLCASKNIFYASELQNQVFYSMLDQVYHSGKLTKSTTEILEDVQKEYYGLPYVENTVSIFINFLHRFLNRFYAFTKNSNNRSFKIHTEEKDIHFNFLLIF